MIYGYARVSTTKQMKNGNSINDQIRALTEAGAEKIVTDDYTGTKMNRPEFTKLIESLQEGDKLIVTKLDRFARTAIEGSQVIRDLVGKGVTVHVLNMGIADNTPMGKLMITMLLAFAEFERDMIVERTQAGKAVAREKGKKVDGRPKKYSTEKMEHAIELLESGISYTQVEKKTGISKSTLIRARRERKAVQIEDKPPVNPQPIKVTYIHKDGPEPPVMREIPTTIIHKDGPEETLRYINVQIEDKPQEPVRYIKLKLPNLKPSNPPSTPLSLYEPKEVWTFPKEKDNNTK